MKEQPDSDYFAYKLFQAIAVLVMLLCAPILFSVGFDSATKVIAKLDRSRKQAVCSESDVEELDSLSSRTEQ